MEMGGMFTVVKVREGLEPGDYRDPGPYKNPEGTVAYEFKGSPTEPPRQQSKAGKSKVDMTIVKPGSKGGHGSRH
jgi:manganese oxidase